MLAVRRRRGRVLTGLTGRATVAQTGVEVLALRGQLARARPARFHRAQSAAAIGVMDIGVVARLHAVHRAVAAAAAAVTRARGRALIAVTHAISAARSGTHAAPTDLAHAVRAAAARGTVRHHASAVARNRATRTRGHATVFVVTSTRVHARVHARIHARVHARIHVRIGARHPGRHRAPEANADEAKACAVLTAARGKGRALSCRRRRGHGARRRTRCGSTACASRCGCATRARGASRGRAATSVHARRLHARVFCGAGLIQAAVLTAAERREQEQRARRSPRADGVTQDTGQLAVIRNSATRPMNILHARHPSPPAPSCSENRRPTIAGVACAANIFARRFDGRMGCRSRSRFYPRDRTRAWQAAHACRFWVRTCLPQRLRSTA